MCANGLVLNGILIFLITFTPNFLSAAQEIDTDRPGMNWKHFPLSKADPSECENACKNDKTFNCKAYTYVKPGVQGQEAVCWLKEGIPLPKKQSCCVSGVVRHEICVHGNSGQLQNPKVDANPYGWGLEYNVAGTGSWIQYSIPTNEVDTVVEAIKIRYHISQPLYGWIKAIHVYDGDKVIQKWDDKTYGGSLSSNEPITRDLLLPFQKPIKVSNGIGISILPETKQAGGLKKIVNMKFISACVLNSASLAD